MAQRPPFDILRAAFLLLALITFIMLAETAFGAVACWWLIYTGRFAQGGCMPVNDLIHEVFSEVLTAVLALLLAARNTPPPPDQ